MHKKQGFTVVELLIVIVVIAILAAIAIVSYNGIQQRARNLKTTAAADSYRTLLDQYYMEHNSTYPPITGANITDMCLGTIYTIDPTYGPDCVVMSPNAKKLSVGSILDTYSSGNSPQPYNGFYINGTSSVRGVRLSYLVDQKLDGVSRQWWLTYILAGQPSATGCPVGPVAYGDWNNGVGNMTMTVPANKLQGDPFGSDAYQCRVPLNP